MTFLSCLAIGVAFLLAVGLLLFAAVLLGWYVPGMIERARQAGGPPRREPGAPDEADAGEGAIIDPPEPPA
jgi:hypothetical protein